MVDVRLISAHDESGRVSPGRFALADRAKAETSFFEKVPRNADLFGGEKFVVPESPIDRLVKNRNVGDEWSGRRGAELTELARQGTCTRG